MENSEIFFLVIIYFKFFFIGYNCFSIVIVDVDLINIYNMEDGDVVINFDME